MPLARGFGPFVVALFVVAAGCGAPARGEGGIGEPCREDRDCARGYCVAGVKGDAPACTISCATTAECPSGWACSAVTQDQVLVCSQGAPTPFGIGANE
ncbi:MAG: hypothetical protein ACFCGT_08415 [Sandaracinaceae bacterium]